MVAAMKRPSLKRPSAATIIATLALVVALSGTGYAALRIPANSVGSKQLKANAVTSAKVKNGSLGAIDFASGTLLKGDKGDKGDTGNPGTFGQLVNRDALQSVSAGDNVTLDSYCQTGEVATGGAVNLIPDGSSLTVLTQRPDGDTFGDSPDNGGTAVGWRAVVHANDGGLLVVHVFCAS